MDSHTLTLRGPDGRAISHPAPRFADFLANVSIGLKKLADRLRPAARPSSGQEARAHLLRVAEEFESTQPSYAADLRAAALRTDFGCRTD